MGKEKLKGLKDFSLSIYKNVSVKIQRKQYPSLEYMYDKNVREIQSLKGDALTMEFTEE